MRKEGRVRRTKQAIRKPVIKPEGGGGATVNSDVRNRTEGVELVIDNFPEVALVAGEGSVEGGSIMEQPVLPRSWLGRK